MGASGDMKNGPGHITEDKDALIAVIPLPEPSKERWNWCNLVCAVLSIPFCFIYGCIATWMALFAYLDYRSQNIAGYQRKLTIAQNFIANTFFFVVLVLFHLALGFLLFKLMELASCSQKVTAENYTVASAYIYKASRDGTYERDLSGS